MGLSSLLKSPFVYESFQRLVGGVRMREECLKVLAPSAGERVLDVGCGPAYYLADMPDVDYHGFDTNERYIEHARKRFGDRGEFHCEVFGAAAAERLGSFDRIMLMGLLHHLDDAECDELLGLLARALKPGGILVALDTVLHDEQNRFEHLLASRDRGEHVRTPEGFSALGAKHFEDVEGRLSDRFWVPSIYWVMTLRTPR